MRDKDKCRMTWERIGIYVQLNYQALILMNHSLHKMSMNLSLAFFGLGGSSIKILTDLNTNQSSSSMRGQH